MPGMSEALIRAVIALLDRAPVRWESVDRDALSASESRALGLLVAAGLVELRAGFDFFLAGQDQGLRLTLEISGDTGLAEALGSVLTDLWARWGETIEKMHTQGMAAAQTVSLVPHAQSHWRLSEQGALARADMHSSDEDVRGGVLMHIMGRWAEIPGLGRHPVPVFSEDRPEALRDLPVQEVTGCGRCVERRWVNQAEAENGRRMDVDITNWQAGADVFMQAMAEHLRGGQGNVGSGKKRRASTRAGTDPLRCCAGRARRRRRCYGIYSRILGRDRARRSSGRRRGRAPGARRR